ncbi:MAG: hypothetical protein NTV32_00040 [Gammaproteobacteria bacterium]|nr:hypothetical protein [Gammaproteobacteria bacterium]
MNILMMKYKMAYQQAVGNEVDKIKAVVRGHAHEWELHEDMMLIDLLDDPSITAGDLTDFLSVVCENEEGNQELRYAVSALQVCLRKAHIEALKENQLDKDENDFHVEDEHFDTDPHFVHKMRDEAHFKWEE